MTKIAVCGVGGRMGQRLAHLVIESDDLELVGATEKEGHAFVGRDAGEAIGVASAGAVVTESLEPAAVGADVAIAFTTPEATLRDAALCAAAGTAMVIGTTGMRDEQLVEFKASVASIPCVFAPNFSTAMNVLFELVERAARVLGEDYDVEVVETHHRQKVDAPRGSALQLAERAAAGHDKRAADFIVHGRHGQAGERTRREIGMHALRLGDVAGDHSVFFGAPGEYLELRHFATSRDSFALGALRAARFATTAQPGLYDMGDVLGVG